MRKGQSGIIVFGTQELLTKYSNFSNFSYNLFWPVGDSQWRVASRDTSLVVQWLRICLAMLGTWVRSLVGELRSHMPWGNKIHALPLENLHTAVRRSPCDTTWEACTLHWTKPHMCCNKHPRAAKKREASLSFTNNPLYSGNHEHNDHVIINEIIMLLLLLIQTLLLC